jgi:acyl-CoA synthetase (AMP-forming)/AMP-acid ligase II
MGTLEFASADEDEATLVTVPPYHIAGISSIVSSTYVGRRIVYLAAFDPASWVSTAASEAITHSMVVPTMLGRILDVMEAEQVSLPALRHLSYGGGKMPVPVIERALALMPHVDFVNAYGLTETSSTIAVLGPDDHRAAFASADPEARKRLGSAGRPLPTVEIEIRGPDGAALPTGERGEIYVRGEQIAGEYLGRSLLVDGGWFPTNDAGYLDDEGFLYLDGRLDDVIVRGARTSRLARSRRRCCRIPPSPRPRSSASPIPSGERASVRSSCSGRARKRRPTSCRRGCASGCGRRRPRRSSSSETSCRTPRRASCCAACCATN